MLKSRRMNETSQGFVAYAPNADITLLSRHSDIW